MTIRSQYIFIFCLSLSLLPLPSNAQKGLRMGIKGAYNSTWLLNKNILDDSKINYVTSFGYNSGFSLGYNFNDKLGFFIEALFDKYNQQFVTHSGSDAQKTTTSLYYISVPVLFRYRLPSGIYLELGAQYHSLTTVKYGYSSSRDTTIIFIYSGLLKNISDIKNNVDENFETSSVSCLIGTGLSINISEHLGVNIGVRVIYGLTDVISEVGGRDSSYGDRIAYTATNTAALGGNMSIEYKF
ncbi:PorT family protein [Candidatus Amoebophilus asiaticus]|nr:PorT family protein [Candidatus Amoebophilus asiaticus]